MIKINKNGIKLFNVPRLFFTIRGQPQSEAVLERLKLIDVREFECSVFESVDQVQECLNGGISPNSAVVLFDSDMSSKCFRYMTPNRPDDVKIIPAWSCGAQWAVKIGTRPRHEGCARQLYANFQRLFTPRLKNGWYPWGQARKKEKPPVSADLGLKINSVMSLLNSGPDLAGSVAAAGYALELPAGSRISWIRVPSEPIECDELLLTETLTAFHEFEISCNQLVQTNKDVEEMVLSGVDIDSSIRNRYIWGRGSYFSIRRPDLHVTKSGVFASENDEMPGGFAELVHIDASYGINQDRWKACFDWLTKDGPLLFLVSSEWSKCYITEFAWLTTHMREKGYNVHILTTDELDKLNLSYRQGGCDGVYLHKDACTTKIGTIWRQFPIFETKGKLAEIVEMAYSGQVRLVPEFAHFGNKVWFSIFRSHSNYFKGALSPVSYASLDRVLPDSHLVKTADRFTSFPCRVNNAFIRSLEELKNLEPSTRDDLVLKICGANNLAARSYGVIMGHGLSSKTWIEWIEERYKLNQPFIIQRRLETSIESLPVMNTKRNCGEMFDCRVLLRPWVFDGDKIVSVSGCAVPSNTLRVHGRVDMAIVPVSLSRQ